MIVRISEDGVKFMPARVALKLINREDVWQSRGLWITDVLEHTENGGNRDAQQVSGGADAVTVSKQMNGIKNEPSCNAVVFRK